MKTRIRTGQYDFPSPEWRDVSQDAKDLIKGMLCTDPSKRLTIDQVFLNRWVSVSIHTFHKICTKIAEQNVRTGSFIKSLRELNLIDPNRIENNLPRNRTSSEQSFIRRFHPIVIYRIMLENDRK
jgi:serine/threonine protein kinase